LNDPIPEAYGENRGLIPDNTYILVGYYSSKQQHDWIKSNKLYNFRIGSGNGSLILDKETVSSKYLLLHTAGDSAAYEIWKIVSKGPKVYSKQALINKGYDNLSQDNYLVITLEKLNIDDFKNCEWKFKELANYSPRRAFPFTSSLTELMKTIEKL
jgi:hypothetical protein